MPEWVIVTGLFVLGFLFILIEAFLIPGFGLSGVLGFISLSVAGIVAFTRLSAAAGWGVTLGSIALLIAFLKLFPHSAAWKKLRLDTAETSPQGFQSAEPNLAELANKKGVSLTILRPSGAARIEGRRYDVIADGEFISKNMPLVVKKIDGNKIIVTVRKKTPGKTDAD